MTLKKKLHQIILGHSQTFHNGYRYWYYLAFVVVFVILVAIAYAKKGS